MKNVTIHAWNNRIFTNGGKVYVNVIAEVEEDGLEEEHKVNLFLTNDINASISVLESLADSAVNQYEVSLGQE